MENVWIQPGGTTGPGYTEDQLRRARTFAETDIRASRAQLAARFGLGDVCAEIADGTAPGASIALEQLAHQLGYATETLEKYLRVTRLAGTALRERLLASAVHVPWRCVTTACVTDPQERARRITLLLELLDTAERAGWPVSLDAAQYRLTLGLASGAEPPAEIVAQLDREEVREAVLAELTKSPAAVLAVLREPAVREVLKDQDVARYVRAQMRPAPSADEALLDELVGSEERDPHADWTIRYFGLVHKAREILLLGPEDFVDVNDPEVWESVESIRDSVASWADRVLQQRPRTIRLLAGK
ncbi:hypothetical protein H8N01_30420 [Streptomyces sp. AC536]|uniref:hypothetical protein n=1 Tax=Streptomyces buecherae TaxID=2763006 RepID=UPI00164E3CF3|nr:hypothetical protein [Streptomyces buecherae]MBC3986782.1 hypothetical protein [Streptomyces buecherae]QNJ38977.1 hypothetical protein H7H31_02895 [Streptomyces buecherae]